MDNIIYDDFNKKDELKNTRVEDNDPIGSFCDTLHQVFLEYHMRCVRDEVNRMLHFTVYFNNTPINCNIPYEAILIKPVKSLLFIIKDVFCYHAGELLKIRLNLILKQEDEKEGVYYGNKGRTVNK